jgi:SAM-dependent methyltransferase
MINSVEGIVSVESFTAPGYCPICEANSTFEAQSDRPVADVYRAGWFRNALKCMNCGSIPRERAFARTLMAMRPNWRELTIHESSPVMRGMSRRMRNECPGYLVSQYSEEFPLGQLHPKAGWRNENLESLTFDDESFDVVISLDVFEHVFHPGRAAREIARTLKPGGICVMTVPVVRPWGDIQRRAAIVDGQVQHLLPEQYHGNPVGDGRSLVTVDWSYAIGAYLTAHSGMPFAVHVIDDMSMGIRDPYNVVLTAVKSPLPDLNE